MSAPYDNGSVALFRVAAISSLLRTVQISTRILIPACSSNFGDILDALLNFDSVSNDQATIIECQLLNTTNGSNFDYNKGNQTVRINGHRDPDEEKKIAIL